MAGTRSRSARTRGGSRKRKSSKSRPLWRRALRWTAVGILGAFVAGVVAILLFYAFARIPEPADIASAQSVRVVDHSGRFIGRISAAADRVSIPLDQMPAHLRDAVIAVEDRSFLTHRGVSLTSIVRAGLANLIGREIRQGGSTITQQYVKNAFVGNERSIIRKAKEAVLALKLERQRSKEEILELYLNTIYLGRGTYGVQAAAQSYFGRQARDLTLGQSALLAGIIHAPEAYDLVGNPARGRARRNEVLELMRAQGRITDERAARAERAPVDVRRHVVGGIAPHFFEDVRRSLERDLGPARLYEGGVTVQVTLDAGMQRAARRAVNAVYDKRSDPEAALVAIDPATGEVRALIGAREFARRQLNVATQARRQPGSTFKPMVLAAAIERGIPVSKTYNAPARITLDVPPEPWPVANYDLASRGRLSVARATELSVNTVYAQLMVDVGPEHVAQVAERAGIRTELPAIYSLALGTAEVSPLELTSAYATFAARGIYLAPTMIERVTGADGEELLVPDRATGERGIEQEVADRVNAVLQGVIERGTGASADIGRPAAGKTGTTERFRDAWFAGYTPDLAAVVWNGYAEESKLMTNVRGRSVSGGSFPAAMWSRFMSTALEGVPPTPFPRPAPSPSPSPSRSSPASLPTPSTPPPTPSTAPSPTTSSSSTPSKSQTPSASASPSPSATGTG